MQDEVNVDCAPSDAVSVITRPFGRVDGGERGFIAPFPLGRSLATATFDRNLASGMIARLQQMHNLRDIRIERHGARVGRLMPATQFGLHVGRRQFEHLDRNVAQPITRRLQPGVQEGLAGAVGRKASARHEGERPSAYASL